MNRSKTPFWQGIICLLILLANWTFLTAQGEGIYLIADPLDKEVRLRWAPESREIWKRNNELGYALERVNLADNRLELSVKNLGAAEQEDWLELGEKSRAALTYAGALYGDLSSQVNGPEELETVESALFGFALLSADQDWETALLAGLGFADSTARPGERYLYLLYRTTAQNGRTRVATVIVNANDRNPLPQSNTPIAAWEDLKVTLKFNHKQTENRYSGYWVERSENDGPFLRRNEQLLVPITSEDYNSELLFFEDILNNNEAEYTYRIVGRSPFGIDGPASEVVKGSGKPGPLPYGPRFLSMTPLDNSAATLEWSVPEAAEGKYQGFRVYRAPDNRSEWEQLTPRMLPANRRTYTDNAPKSGWLYLIHLIDENGYEIPSRPRMLVLQDHDPPAAPAGLTGTMDSSGVVRLSWLPNIEEDHRGYRVYRSNQRVAEYVQVTEDVIFTTSFTDTVSMKFLNRYVYYKLKATDYAGNYSPISEEVAVVRPDLFPPSAAILANVTADTKGVNLNWQPSISQDVDTYALYRAEGSPSSNSVWEEIYAGPADTRTFRDTSGQIGKNYQYRLRTIDESGLFTDGEVINAGKIDNGSRGTISQFAVEVLPGRRIKLTFDCYYPVDPDYFEVYRSINEGPLLSRPRLKRGDRFLRKIGQHSFEYIDTNLATDATSVAYRVLARYADGGFSNQSAEVKVSLE